jgi:hypothetical protein
MTPEVRHFITEVLRVGWFFGFRLFATCGVAEFPPNACRGERRGVWGRAAPIKPVRPAPGILARGQEAKRAVRAALIVFDTPAFQDNTRFAQIAEEFAVQALGRYSA